MKYNLTLCQLIVICVIVHCTWLLRNAYFTAPIVHTQVPKQTETYNSLTPYEY